VFFVASVDICMYVCKMKPPEQHKYQHKYQHKLSKKVKHIVLNVEFVF